MDTAAQNMEESAMRLHPLQTITTLDTCATSNNPTPDNLTQIFCFHRVKNCTCWARKVQTEECIDPGNQCEIKFEGFAECAKEKPNDDYVPTGLKCVSTK